MRRVLVGYALSGFISLGYQVAWFRIVTDWFGSTNYTFALVVVNFIGGLATGALFSQRIADALRSWSALRPGLRVYGAVELAVALAIGLTAGVSLIPADLWGHFPYVERAGIWSPALGWRLFQGATAALAIFVPTFFMGVTYPLLCDVFRLRFDVQRFPASLYAWNTLGACAGVLACQFVLLPRIGHDQTLWAMAACNALLAVFFLASRFEAEMRTGNAEPVLARESASTPALSPGVLLMFVTLSGFLSGAMEGDLFKRITFVIELNPGATMTFVSFWAVLAIFFASACVRRFGSLRLMHLKIAIALAAAYCLWVWPQVDLIRDWVERTVLPVDAGLGPGLEGFSGLQFPTHLLQLLVFAGIMVFPPFACVSALLPWVCDQLQAAQTHLGRAYGLNTLAFCGGLLGFVLVAPAVSIFYSLKLFPIAIAIGALWMFLTREARPLAVWQPALLIGGFALAAWAVPAEFDRAFFRPGSPPAEHPVRAVKSNGAHTTFVVDVRGNPRLFFGRMQMSATNLRAQTYMRLMAHFPLMLTPEPRNALLICLGVGNTGSAIAAHRSITHIDIVDLNDKVLETAPEFSTFNRDLHLDPRVRMVHDDGRNFLNTTDRRYDLITSEPPPPLSAGVYRLYSQEYYRAARERLTANGFMTQWLPLFLMTPEAVDGVVRTFTAVFPHSLLIAGFGTDYILVGSPSPIDASRMAQRFAQEPAAAAELARFNIQGPRGLAARIVQTPSSLQEHYGSARVISDQHNDLENRLPDPRARPVVAYDPLRVLDSLEGSAPALAAQVRPILIHLGRLRYHVQGFPFETLATVESGSGIALADADWVRLSELYLENASALRAGRRDLAERALQGFLEIAAEQPEVLLQLANMKLASRDFSAAESLLSQFLTIEPGDPNGLALRRALERKRPR